MRRAAESRGTAPCGKRPPRPRSRFTPMGPGVTLREAQAHALAREGQPMSESGSVTEWLGRLLGGDPAAAHPLWERYVHRPVAGARHKLAGTPRGAADEEDVALSAFDSFCRAARQHRFPRLDDRDDLWMLLLLLTDRKASDQRKHATRTRRG